MMRYAVPLAMVFGMLAVWFAIAQQRTTPREIPGHLVVAVCGTLPAPAYVAGTYAAPTVDVTGKLCVSQ